MTRLKNLLFLLLIGLLLFPAVQKMTGLIRTKPLNGFFAAASKPAFSCSTWMKQGYQDQYRLYMEDSVGFKPDLVRLYNQVDFSLFSIPHASKLVAGKNGYLFAESYIYGYLGKDFVGHYYIRNKVERLRFLQDYLWKEKRILLFVAFAPGKAYYYPDYIPDRFLDRERGETNYECYVQGCLKMGVNHIDFNRWLITMKDTSRYMLYPKTGIHWSSYGAFLCADSLRRYIEQKMERKLPHLVLDSIEVAAEARDEDNDMDRTMNLIWKIPHPLMAYPRFHFVYDSLQPKPKALFVGDSFYWYWHYNGIIGNTFSNLAFWYYNQDVYPEHFKTPTNAGNINYTDSILSQNVIILLQTNGGYGDLGSGWVDRAWDYFYPGPTREREIESLIKANPEAMKSMEKKAGERGVSVDAMIRMDAIYSVNQELLKLRKKQNP
jgi:hypothetical protein